MKDDSKEAKLTLHITKVGDEAGNEDLNQLTYDLIRNLKAMDVETVTLLDEQDDMPGAKAILVVYAGILRV